MRGEAAPAFVVVVTCFNQENVLEDIGVSLEVALADVEPDAASSELADR